ncbi:alanine racemase [Bordetella genomosp. 8]|uniref:Alanine racemase n=1 Tax=Bordetella genomosp. 8 TaxID=1416806 RepID=A0A1W6YJL3_9BORD|nr:alanine racemase [Bordetella genomosp. 8]ARP81252.1 alanine racemase [Bordetella genomosp. 8]
MSRPAYASIDLDALRGNYTIARQMHGGRVLAVLKADAYGHGAAACARALAGLADGYAVAFTDEALALRQAGIDAPILVLEGAFDAPETHTAVRHGLWLAMHRSDQIAWLAEASTASDAGIHAWLKVDSGMHRAGFVGAEVKAAHQALQAIPAVSQVTLMTHFARADEPHSDMTAMQMQSFDTATAGLPGPRSLCNSAGLMAWPDARHDWGRAGIMLYGADPLPASGATLRPVMTLRSEIIGVRELAAGEPVGYGATFITPRPTRVGLVAMGYADGYPRNAPNGTPVAIDGQAGRLIGRVSMDMLTVDLTDHPQAGIGSNVELWGAQVPVSDVARAAGTIAYEILSNVKRVRRIHTSS